MTDKEALAVVGVVIEADGGCGPCVKELFKKLRTDLPEINWTNILSRFYLRLPKDQDCFDDYRPDEHDK